MRESSAVFYGLSILTGATLLLVAVPASADVEIAPLVLIDFSTFDGSGFAPEPAPGQLDSDDWSVTLDVGFLVDFGGTADAGSTFAHGTGPGATDVPGIWAFDVDGAGLIGLGVQPSDATFTPGQIALRLINNTGAEINEIQVEYTVWVDNNVDRSNSLNLLQSANNVAYTQVGGNFVSPAAADKNGFTATEIVHVVVPADPIADGAQFYIAWAGADVSGTGSRDEFAIEGIVIRLVDACGNGILDTGEACDDGLGNANTAACTRMCAIAACGDGFVHEGVEACDDGNTDDDDDCPADCMLEGADSTGADSTGADSTGADSTGVDVTGDTLDTGTDTDVTATGASMTDATATNPTTTSPTGGIDTDDGDETGSGGEDEETSGCSCNSSGNAAPIWGMLGMLVLARRRYSPRKTSQY